MPLAVVGNPIEILALSVVFIVAAIAYLRLPAFFALMIAAGIVAIMGVEAHGTGNHWVEAVGMVTTAFGEAAGQIGFTIALAAVIGVSLMESGSADKIVRRMIAAFGEASAAPVLLACGFMLSAPVFADTVFMLMIPIARALSLRTGKDYLLYILAVCCGSIITNGTVPPAPGPLVAAESLRLNLGMVIIAGTVFGIVPAIWALIGARWFNARSPIPVRPAMGASIESLSALATKPESELPPFWLAIAPVLTPFALISAAAVLAFKPLRVHSFELYRIVAFLGDKNVALLIGAAIAVAVHARQKKINWRRVGSVLGTPLETGGIIILTVSAGAAYGEMIKHTGLSDQVRELAGAHAINYVVLAWGLAVVLRAAQGSATVAMITGTAITASVAGPAGFGVHPIYILLAAGYGSKCLSWMNDAGFWIISRVSGITPGEALRSWTILGSSVSVVGLIEVWLVSMIWPHLPF
jgi:gluconate:H+ symporter, GntP family